MKTSSSKSGKTAISQKGISPWFWSKIGHVSMFFLKVIQANKMCFTIFQNEKTHFQTIKTRNSTSGKTAIFPKGLFHGFGQKLTILTSFFRRQYRPGKCVFRYSKTKKRVSQLLNKKLKSCKNCHFSKWFRPQFWSKIGNFSIIFFGNIGQENVFYHILERKNVSLT